MNYRYGSQESRLRLALMQGRLTFSVGGQILRDLVRRPFWHSGGMGEEQPC